MRIAVCVKQTHNIALPLEFAPDGVRVTQPRLAGACSLNPPDRAALEEAIRLREESPGTEVSVVTLGPAEVDYVARYCLARGVDRVTHLLGETPDAFTAALALSQVLKDMDVDLVLCGTRSIDDATGQVPPAIAELLALPQATGVMRLEIDQKEMKARVWRRLERGKREVVECRLPALIAVEPYINEPRYVSLHALQLAAQRDVHRIDLSTLGNLGHPLVQTLKVAPPRPRPKKISVPDATLSADERMALLLNGGPPQPKKTGGYLEGDVPTVVSGIISFLQAEGLL